MTFIDYFASVLLIIGGTTLAVGCVATLLWLVMQIDRLVTRFRTKRAIEIIRDVKEVRQ